MNRYARFLLVITIIALLAVCGCNYIPTSPTSTTTSAITLTDQLGRTVTIKKIPQRIISLSPSNTEILFALGLGDKVVGVTDYCDYPPEATNKPSIGDYFKPTIEQIVALEPDLVLADSIQKADTIPILEEHDITVFGIDPKNLNEVLQSITIIGDITGAKDAAANLVSQMQNRIDAIANKTKDLTNGQKPGVYYIVWHDPLMVAGSATLEDEFINLAGGINIARDLSSYSKSLNWEAVVAANPDVIIVSSNMDTDETLKYIMSKPELVGTSARQNGKVYGVDTNLSGRAGPRIVMGLQRFAECIHPELFPLPD
jgi:iron complex transport system substrate-binding protein